MTEEEITCEKYEKIESRNTKRWDQLYELVSSMLNMSQDKKIKQKKRDKIREKEREKEEKVLEGCTFNPVLYNTNVQISK